MPRFKPETNPHQLFIEQLVQNGVRWCNNILTELAGNYSTKLPDQARHHLRSAMQHLHDFDHCLRFPTKPERAPKQ